MITSTHDDQTFMHFDDFSESVDSEWVDVSGADEIVFNAKWATSASNAFVLVVFGTNFDDGSGSAQLSPTVSASFPVSGPAASGAGIGWYRALPKWVKVRVHVINTSATGSVDIAAAWR